MREVRKCTFCATKADGVFELMPDSLEPSEDEQRRIALCSTCQTRLTSLIDPLLRRLLEGESPETVDRSTTGRSEEGSDSGSSEQRQTFDHGDTSVAEEDTETPVSRGSSPTTDTGTTTDGVTPKRASYTVLKFLHNRELPIERSTVIELAASAYDIDERTVSTGIDTAIEEGALREEDGRLFRT